MFKLAVHHLNFFFYSDSRPGYPARVASQIKGIGRALHRSLFIAFLRFWLAAYIAAIHRSRRRTIQ
jgi:hypothetical protein